MIIELIYGGAALLLWGGIYFYNKVLKKKADYHIVSSLEALNKRSVEIVEEEAGQIKIIKEEQVRLKKYIKKNELVLYNVKERSIAIWNGHNVLDQIFKDVLEEDIGLEYDEADVIHKLKYANESQKIEIERWFSNSFRMSVVDYLKYKDGINKYGFSNN